MGDVLGNNTKVGGFASSRKGGVWDEVDCFSASGNAGSKTLGEAADFVFCGLEPDLAVWAIAELGVFKGSAGVWIKDSICNVPRGRGGKSEAGWRGWGGEGGKVGMVGGGNETGGASCGAGEVVMDR